MKDNDLIGKVIEKRDFSQLPLKDVRMALARFERREVSDEEKRRLTRDLLHRVFGAFTSKKLLSLKDKDAEWVLKKHLSTRERLPFYEAVYTRLLKGLDKKLSVIDLGAGVNGFGYEHFEKAGFDARYVGVESVGQLVDLMNSYFRKNSLNAEALHFSLFELEKVKKLLKKQKKPRVVFLFKVVDSLEMLERDYSKKLLSEVADLSERVVVSFPTESMIRRKVFRADRKWLVDFVKNNFEVVDEFVEGSEKFLILERKS